MKRQRLPGYNDFDMDMALFAREGEESKLRGIEEQWKLYTLKAPITGRLGRIQVVPGQSVNPGTIIAHVIDLDEEIDALCFAPPNVARRLQLHQAAVIEIGDQEGAEGEIVFISPMAEPDTGQFAVKARFSNRAPFFWEREWRAN